MALVADAAGVIEGLTTRLQVTVVGDDFGAVLGVTRGVSTLTIHDAIVVARHHRNDTDAVLTSDPVIAEHAPVRRD